MHLTRLYYSPPSRIVIFMGNFSTRIDIVLLILYLEEYHIVTSTMVSLHEDYYLK